MIGWDEEKIKIFMLLSMAQTLKKKAESAHYQEFELIKEQYNKLFQSLSSVDAYAPEILPKPSSLQIFNDVKFAIEQLINYLTPKAIPLFFGLMTSIRDLGFLRIENPLTPLTPILAEWKLSVNWAVGACALALIEVMVNKKLEKLGLSREGSFENRWNRLSSKAEEKGMRLPDLLAGPFYKARSKVIHEGKEPSPEEIEIIIKYLTLCSDSLKKI